MRSGRPGRRRSGIEARDPSSALPISRSRSGGLSELISIDWRPHPPAAASRPMLRRSPSAAARIPAGRSRPLFPRVVSNHDQPEHGVGDGERRQRTAFTRRDLARQDGPEQRLDREEGTDDHGSCRRRCRGRRPDQQRPTPGRADRRARTVHGQLRERGRPAPRDRQQRDEELYAKPIGTQSSR